MTGAHRIVVTVRSTVFTDGGAFDDYTVRDPRGSTVSGTVTDGFDPASSALMLLYPGRAYRERARVVEHAVLASRPTTVPGSSRVASFASEVHHLAIALPSLSGGER